MYYSFHINSWIDTHQGSNCCLNHIDTNGLIDPHYRISRVIFPLPKHNPADSVVGIDLTMGIDVVEAAIASVVGIDPAVDVK